MIIKNFDLVVIGGGIVGTWIAKRALTKGLSVGLIEIGPSDPALKNEATPKIEFPEKIHLGANAARNQCLTGNSKFWGGGLITNDNFSLSEIFNDNDYNILNSLKQHTQIVAKNLNISLTEREKFSSNDFDILISEITVLSGKKRDLWNQFYKANTSNLNVFTNSKVSSIEIDANKRKIKSIEIISNIKETYVIISDQFVIAMGVIDSNIFVLENLIPFLNGSKENVGIRLHDHWSVPIGKLKWNNRSYLEKIYPPSFRGDQIIGKRIEIRSNEHKPFVGFIHVQASYDTTPPYSFLKNILFHRQKDLPFFELVKNVINLFSFSSTLIRLGWERYLKKKLYIPDGTELNIVLDFESCVDRRNKICPSDSNRYNLFWDVREEDIEAFKNLLDCSEKIINKIIKDDMYRNNVSLLKEWTIDIEGYLKNNAIDTYHLGGGLNTGLNPENSVVNKELRFNGIDNLSIISTSVFNRPGIASPVLTLLTLAERYVQQI